ncbi:hypothetical protein [Pontibacter beigongshangensis]|uniref:hypothetical protein n=1 Tax=Pontibacter beigongshangensis TaxID=2574733 RepID=UPI00165059BF|nr:hypothetical protein [Pontibacter beigongshangensis]
MRNRLYILFALILFACDKAQPIEDLWLPDGFDYAYSITEYNGDPKNSENFRCREYYDSTDRILLEIGGSHEGCLMFLYDSTGRLLEKRWGRNCQGAIRDSMVYDAAGNLIGSVTPKDSLNPNPRPFRQTKFYDNQNRLVKEFIRDFTDADGNRLEFWRELTYAVGKISKELITQNGNLEWDGTYEYDKSDRLIAIKKKRGEVYQNEYFRYDSKGKLLEKERTSNEYPLTPEVTHSAWNNRTVYDYDSNGFLVKEISISHKGKEWVVGQYVRKNKNP